MQSPHRRMHATLPTVRVELPAAQRVTAALNPNSVAPVRGAWNGILKAPETLNNEPLEPRDDRP